MADTGAAADVLHDAPKVARRPSFRRTLRELQDALPPEYLEALEEKRKQLDDSIHRFVAAKEREYKQYEKDVRQQARSAQGNPAPPVLPPTNGHGRGHADGHGHGHAALSASKRRADAESPQRAPRSSPPGTGQQQPPPPPPSSATAAAATALLAGRQGERDSEAVDERHAEERAILAGLRDRRQSEEREREFVGLFTPPFLPAIDHKSDRHAAARRESAPPSMDRSRPNGALNGTMVLPRSESDTAAQARAHRPGQLQLTPQTSSLSAAADGKRASALKSPTQSMRKPPQRKRVSLAVGDTIVAPNDNVPIAMTTKSSTSHSRPRSPISDRELGGTTGSASISFAKHHVSPTSPDAPVANGGISAGGANGKDAASAAAAAAAATDRTPTSAAIPATAAATNHTNHTSPAPVSKATSTIDPDGDLFDLEAEDSDIPPPRPDAGSHDAIESDEDEPIPDITGRLAHDASRAPPARDVTAAASSPPGLEPGDTSDYDPEAGVLPAPGDAPVTVEEGGGGPQPIHIEFGPGSACASQQPTQPGFRRPSVVHDPVFAGADYARAEAEAANEELYGSSFSRPTSKGSFTGGSLGESYMARHAEEMMKARVARGEQDVRS